MSRGRKLKQHLHQLQEIRDIMDAMKNLAFVENHKLDKLINNQRQLVEELEIIAADFLNFYPFSSPVSDKISDIWLVFGSERGFCGDFNDTLLDYLDKQMPAKGDEVLLIPVGSKLYTRLRNVQRVAYFAKGPDAVDEIASVLNTLIGYINALQSSHENLNVHALFHHADNKQITSCQLIPPFAGDSNKHIPHSNPPLLNMAPEVLLSKIFDHYLLISLEEIVCMSLLAENYQRIQHMSGAVKRIDDITDKITRKYHMLRQEEITEEIEVILLNAMEK